MELANGEFFVYADDTNDLSIELERRARRLSFRFAQIIELTDDPVKYSITDSSCGLRSTIAGRSRYSEVGSRTGPRPEKRGSARFACQSGVKSYLLFWTAMFWISEKCSTTNYVD